MHFGGPIRRTADLQKVITVGLCADQITFAAKNLLNTNSRAVPGCIESLHLEPSKHGQTLHKMTASRQPEDSSQNIVLGLLEEAGTG